MGCMDPPKPIGIKIKRARERLRLTQEQLGHAVGVSQKTIDNWEHDRRYPKSAIGALEQVLDVSFDGDSPPGEPEDIVELADRLEEMARELRARQKEQRHEIVQPRRAREA